MNAVKKLRNKVAFVIMDKSGFVWGMAPSKVQARKQIAWFLPKGNIYTIDIMIVPE